MCVNYRWWCRDRNASLTDTDTHMHTPLSLSYWITLWCFPYSMRGIITAYPQSPAADYPACWQDRVVLSPLCSSQLCVCLYVHIKRQYLMRVFVYSMWDRKVKIYSACIHRSGIEKREISFLCICVGSFVCRCVVLLSQAAVCGWYLQLQLCWSPQHGITLGGRQL